MVFWAPSFPYAYELHAALLSNRSRCYNDFDCPSTQIAGMHPSSLLSISLVPAFAESSLGRQSGFGLIQLPICVGFSANQRQGLVCSCVAAAPAMLATKPHLVSTEACHGFCISILHRSSSLSARRRGNRGQLWIKPLPAPLRLKQRPAATGGVLVPSSTAKQIVHRPK